MSQFDFINKRRESIPDDTKIFIQKSFDIIERLHELMEEQNISQKELAQKMGKTEAEVSKWINGVQNFTIKTLSKLEAALGQEVVQVPCKRNLQTLSWVQHRKSHDKKIFVLFDTHHELLKVNESAKRVVKTLYQNEVLLSSFNESVNSLIQTRRKVKSMKEVGEQERQAWMKLYNEGRFKEKPGINDTISEQTNIGV